MPADRRPPGRTSPEWTVLLAAVRPQAAGSSQLSEALAEPLDWDALLDYAFHHDVAPMLLDALQGAPSAAHIPAPVLTTLRRARAANALRHKLLMEELATILAWARDRGIAVIVLKGAALGATVYAHPELRPMRDVDLLARPGGFESLEAALTARGYTLVHPWAAAREWHLDHDYHLAYRRRQEGLPDTSIELHWDVDVPSRPCRLDLDGIWARAVPVTIAGVTVRTLSPEDALLHLCLHACKHRLTASVRIYGDIARLVDRGLDWGALQRRAQQSGAGAFVSVPLQLARDLLDAPVPGSVIQALASPSFDPRIIAAAKHVLGRHPRTAALDPDFYDLTWNRNTASRRRVLARVLSPDVVAARAGIPRRSVRLWWEYPRRLAHLCRTYLPDLWKFLRAGRRVRDDACERELLAGFLRPFESVRRTPS